MNYLAHLCLSGNKEEILIGNYIGDSLKGISTEKFSKEIQLGIKLHRFIDDFTDHHPVFISSKRLFTPTMDKYSGVVTDIFYDHFLALHFDEIMREKLPAFSERCYTIINKHYALLPEKARQFYHYMTDNNILLNYAKEKGIKKVLSGMSYRIQNRCDLTLAIPVFHQHFSELEKDFLLFFPEIKKSCSDFLEKFHTNDSQLKS